MRPCASLSTRNVAPSCRRRASLLVPSTFVVASPLKHLEVAPFGWQTTARRLSALGAEWTRRLAPDGQPFITDGGHIILDCRFQSLDSARLLQQRLDSTVGVMEHGLFLDMISEAIVGRSAGEPLILRRS